jgi:multiple sugar transport system substrate-binding protein
MYDVMIIDDDTNIRERIKKMVRWDEMGLNLVCEAEDSDKSMELFRIYSPNIIIIDINIPIVSGIIVAKEMITYDAGPEKVMVSMASGTTPDIYLDGTARIAPAIERGLCVDVSDVIKDLDGIILPGYTKVLMKDGKNYCVPQASLNGYNISVNSVLAKKLGVYDMLPADKVHWSYEQFLDFNRACYKKGKAQDIYPTMLYAGSRSSDAAYYSFLMSGGAMILNDDHTKAICNSEAGIKSLDIINTLVKENLVPKGAATTKDEDISGPFYSGKLVYLINGAGAQDAVMVYNKIKSGELDGDTIQVEFFQYPTPDGKADPLSLNWGISAHIIFKNKNDADKIAASKLFIKEFVTNPIYADELAKGAGVAPVIDVDIDYGDEYINKQVKFANECNSKYSTDQMGVQEPWWAQVREAFFPELQALFVGKKTSKQALDDFVSKANDIIAEATKK